MFGAEPIMPTWKYLIMSMETYREMGMSGEYRMTKVRKLSRPTRVLSAGSNSRRLLALSPGAPSCRYQSFCAQNE